MYPTQAATAGSPLADTVRKTGVLTTSLHGTDGELNQIFQAYERLEAAYQRLCNPTPRSVKDGDSAPTAIQPTVEAQLGHLHKKTADLAARLHNLADRLQAALA